MSGSGIKLDEEELNGRQGGENGEVEREVVLQIEHICSMSVSAVFLQVVRIMQRAVVGF